MKRRLLSLCSARGPTSSRSRALVLATSEQSFALGYGSQLQQSAMNGSHFELGSLGVSISSDSADERSTVEFSVTNSGGTNSTNAMAWSPGVLLGPEHRTEEAVALALLPGVLCCCCVALLVGVARWLRARATCSAPEDGEFSELPRHSSVQVDENSDDVARPKEDPGYHGAPGVAAAPRFARAGLGLEMSSDGSTVTNVGTRDTWATTVMSGSMLDGVHECAFKLRKSERGLILLGVVRPSFDPNSDSETAAHDTPDAWAYCAARARDPRPAVSLASFSRRLCCCSCISRLMVPTPLRVLVPAA